MLTPQPIRHRRPLNVYKGLSRLPTLDEVGIDLLRLKLFGRWQASGSMASRLQRLHHHLIQLRNDNPYIERMGRTGTRTFVSLRSRAPLTIRSAKLTFSHDQTARHNLFIELALNPTRTLNRLLGMYARAHEWQSRVGFHEWIDGMTPDEFFLDPDPAGPGEWDNFISRATAAQLELGRDPFATFLPVYCVKLQGWIEGLFPVPETGTEASNRYPDAVGPLSMAVDPRETRFQHCEVYFERRVASAHSIVDRIARAALVSINSVRVFVHPDEGRGMEEGHVTTTPVSINEVERKGPGISVTAPITQDRALLIYAKRRDRIRFELKYTAFTGRGSDELDGLHEGTLGFDLWRRMEDARRSLPNDAHWPDALALARHHEQADATSLIGLIGALHVACRECDPETFNRALHDLMVTGGISAISEEPELLAVAEALARSGIVVQRRVRVRDRSGIGRRYVLAEPYLSARELILGNSAPLADNT